MPKWLTRSGSGSDEMGTAQKLCEMKKIAALKFKFEKLKKFKKNSKLSKVSLNDFRKTILLKSFC